MNDISQYLNDHNAAGACAQMYYAGQHDVQRCLLAPGVCSMIAYLVAELKNAEQKARYNSSPAPQPLPQYVPVPNGLPPLSPIPPVTTAGDNGNLYAKPGPGTYQGEGNLGNSSGLATWLSDGVEKR